MQNCSTPFRSLKARHCPQNDGQPATAGERRPDKQEPTRCLGLRGSATSSTSSSSATS